MKSLENTIKDVERDLVINITLALRHKRLNKKTAREMAREFIANQPYKSKGELFEKLNEMSEKYREIRKVYVKYAFEYEDEKIEKSLIEMRSYMKQKDFENAIKVAKGGA